MKVGVMAPFDRETDIERRLSEIEELELDNCQLVCWDEHALTDSRAEAVRNAENASSVRISAFWCGWPGPKVWNFRQGPITLGLVPPAYRARRLEVLLAGVEFAAKIGVRDVATHVGFIPENPTDPDYFGVLEAVKVIAEASRKHEGRFLLETGQETPVTLLRLIEDTGFDNVGLNFDPANLIMYGKANPIDALDIVGRYVYGVHAKDGDYPTDGMNLGKEQPVGWGKVDFPALVGKLKSHDYDDALTIEREIKGDQQRKDIIAARDMLRAML